MRTLLAVCLLVTGCNMRGYRVQEVPEPKPCCCQKDEPKIEVPATVAVPLPEIRHLPPAPVTVPANLLTTRFGDLKVGDSARASTYNVRVADKSCIAYLYREGETSQTGDITIRRNHTGFVRPIQSHETDEQLKILLK